MKKYENGTFTYPRLRTKTARIRRLETPYREVLSTLQLHTDDHDDHHHNNKHKMHKKESQSSTKCIHILFCRRYFGCEPIQIRGIDDEYYAKYDLGMYSIQMPKIVGILFGNRCWRSYSGTRQVNQNKN